jgi:hypothetical protein
MIETGFNPSGWSESDILRVFEASLKKGVRMSFHIHPDA